MMRMSVTPLTTPKSLVSSIPKHVASGVASRGRAVNDYAEDGFVASRFCKSMHEGLSDGGGLSGSR